VEHLRQANFQAQGSKIRKLRNLAEHPASRGTPEGRLAGEIAAKLATAGGRL